jgi:hypothetical protein
MEEEIDLDRTLAERVWQLRPLVDRYVADHGLGEAVDADGLATSLARACPEGRSATDAVRRCLHLLAVGIVASGLADREAERLGCDPATFRRMRRALSRPPRDGEGWGDPQVPPREAVAGLAARAGRYERLPEGDPYRDRHRELERLAGEGRPLLLRVAARLVPADADDVVQDALDHCMQRLLRDFLLERPPLLREVGDGDLRARMEAYVTVAVRRRAFDVLRRGRAQVAPPRPARRVTRLPPRRGGRRMRRRGR